MDLHHVGRHGKRLNVSFRKVQRQDKTQNILLISRIINSYLFKIAGTQIAVISILSFIFQITTIISYN